MTAHQELASLYEEWRRLSEEEGTAIRQSAWDHVHCCQEEKNRLQPLIISATDRLHCVSQADQSPMSRQPNYRTILSQLIQLEHRNSLWLEEKERAAEKERGELNRSARNLKRLRKGYTQPPGSGWQSYS